MANDKLAPFGWVLIFSIWASGLMLGYGMCLHAHRHDTADISVANRDDCLRLGVLAHHRCVDRT